MTMFSKNRDYEKADKLVMSQYQIIQLLLLRKIELLDDLISDWIKIITELL